jgi:hypothetical protein
MAWPETIARDAVATVGGREMTPEQISDEISLAFKSMLNSTSAGQLLTGPRPGWTAAVKQTMGDLGKRLKFYVAASGYQSADQGEFLYDMVWYELDGQGNQLSQPMVMECQWKCAHPAEVDDDFQKLVQARADVRVWVAVSANASEIDGHVANCEKQIRLFRGSLAGDQYIFLFFEWASRTHALRTFKL